MLGLRHLDFDIPWSLVIGGSFDIKQTMSTAIIPIPQAPVTVRPATLADVPFIDALQKKHANSVGFMPRGQLVGKITAGDVIIAENAGEGPVGYCIGTDRYFKHDDIGIIYHLNVVPGKQRAFVGAT